MKRASTVAVLFLAVTLAAGPAVAREDADDGARLLRDALRSGTTDAVSWARVVRWVLEEKEETVAAGFAHVLRELATSAAAASGDAATRTDPDDAQWDATSRAVFGTFESLLDDARHHRRRDGDAIARGLVAVAGPAVIAALQQSDPGALEGAAALVRAMAPPARDVVAPLARALRDPDPSIRLGAATMLGALGPSAASAVPALEAARKDRDARVRDAAGKALSEIAR